MLGGCWERAESQWSEYSVKLEDCLGQAESAASVHLEKLVGWSEWIVFRWIGRLLKTEGWLSTEGLLWTEKILVLVLSCSRGSAQRRGSMTSKPHLAKEKCSVTSLKASELKFFAL